MNHQPHSATVAQLIRERVAESSKSPSQIANEADLSSPNLLQLVGEGRAKLPVQHVQAVATALGVDPAYLVRLVVTEYLPGVWEVVEQALQGTALTANERKLVDAYRQVTGNSDAVPTVIDRDAVLAIVLA
ncbi:hypothetical protein [Curvibacter gracilis]|uniref:hypothetical protein n=1 Tax=Curvibacter gracilis TaxID=230310 RepID=UPI0004899DF4|nr:hypothetical protein [Curvibacter gracilis]